MANKITGSTDTTGAVSVLPKTAKTICIVAQRGTTPTATENKIFDVVGSADATSKWGSGSKAIDLVKILIVNGVSSIKGIMTTEVGETTPTLEETYDTALDALLLDDSIDVIICDQVDSKIITKIKDHLDLAESEDMERYAVVGVTSALGTPSDFTTVAGTTNNKRVFIPGPDSVDASGVAQSGIYIAAGLAALIVTETDDPALPMNGVEMLGFEGLQKTLLNAEKDILVTGGVVPIYTSPSGRPTVHRLVTTYTKDTQGQPDTIWQEGTTVMIADHTLSSVRSVLRSNYKRTKNVTRILKSIRTDVIGVLQKLNDLEIIENFDEKTVVVIKDPEDVYGALVDYEFDVVTPLYTITIKQHMKI